MTQKTVFLRPAHRDAWIPDPSHPGQKLPYAENGVEVVYDAYWAGHIAHKDVVEVEQVAKVEAVAVNAALAEAGVLSPEEHVAADAAVLAAAPAPEPEPVVEAVDHPAV